MIEFVLIVAFIIVARRLNRASRVPRTFRIDVYHHLVPGPGERAEEPRSNGEVVPFAPRHRPSPKIVA